MTPYKILLRYVPEVWDPRHIGMELCAFTRTLGLTPSPDVIHGPIHWKRGWFNDALHAEVRRHTISAPSATDWHKDGDTTPGSLMDCAIVTWADRTSTEFRIDKEIFQPSPFEVVIFRNLGCFHRRPLDAPRKRWMFRQRVLVPTWLN